MMDGLPFLVVHCEFTVHMKISVARRIGFRMLFLYPFRLRSLAPVLIPQIKAVILDILKARDITNVSDRRFDLDGYGPFIILISMNYWVAVFHE